MEWLFNWLIWLVKWNEKDAVGAPDFMWEFPQSVCLLIVDQGY